MAVLKCKMCGGDVVLAADKTFGTCEYCGCTMTFPKVNDDQRAAAFNRGNHFRRIGEFDKALEVYERIVAEDENDAEAHWCCALCRFGIEYVEDPTTYEWLPTCHRASFDSFLEDVDFLSALEHSDGVTRRQYQKDAAKIAEVQRGILATSQNTEPYDVFICYKELDENGNRTRDSILAQEIYYRLKDRDWRVFFSRISLEDVPGTQYEPYIFAALNSALVMVVVGTSAENLNSVWVKNEWSRFLSLMKKNRSKLLIPCYRDMDPYDLPDQLSVLMSYDIGRIGFIQDLIRGVDKVLSAEKKDSVTETVKETVVVQQGGGPNVTALIKRGNLALEDGEWESANNFFDQALNMDAECAEAYLGMGLAELHCHSTDEYIQNATTQTPHVRTLYLEKDTKHILRAREKYPVEGFLEWEDISGFYDGFDLCYTSTVNGQKEIKSNAMSDFEKNRHFSRAISFANKDFKELLEQFRQKLSDRLERNIKLAEEDERRETTRLKSQYEEFLKQADHKAAEKHSEAEKKQKAIENADEINKQINELRDKRESDIRIYKSKVTQKEEAKTQLAEAEQEKQILKQRIAQKTEELSWHQGLFSGKRRRELESEISESRNALKDCEERIFYYKEAYRKTLEEVPQKPDVESMTYEIARLLHLIELYKDAYIEYDKIRGYRDVDRILQLDEQLHIAFDIDHEEKLNPFKTIGGIVSFGSYEQKYNSPYGNEQIDWIVLDVQENRSLLISCYELDTKPYNKTYEDTTWEECTLRYWLNHDFLETAFTDEEEEAILESIVDNSERQGNNDWNTDGGNNTKDKVFLLSYNEARRYFSSNEKRCCRPTYYATMQGAYVNRENETGWWWLRSPGNDQSYAACVNFDGSLNIDSSVRNGSSTVRPALWIDLKSRYFY